MKYDWKMFKDKCRLGPFPALACAAREPAKTLFRHTMVLFHGFGNEKEDIIEDLEWYAGQGFLAVAVDAVGHGERRDSAVEGKLQGSPEEQNEVFHDLVVATSAEVPALIDSLDKRHWLHGGGAALVGVSMGGFIAFGGRVAEPRVDTVVSVSGSPRWDLRPQMSPEEMPGAFWPARVLAIHGDRDEVVPPGPAREFIEALRSFYAAAPKRLRYIPVPGTGHIFSPEAWMSVRRTVADFCAAGS